jgi:hypothetical protein
MPVTLSPTASVHQSITQLHRMRRKRSMEGIRSEISMGPARLAGPTSGRPMSCAFLRGSGPNSPVDARPDGLRGISLVPPATLDNTSRPMR